MGGAHDTHTNKYSFACDTCHSGHGYGTGTHNDLNNDVAFDLNGLATRNGADSNTPTWTAGNAASNTRNGRPLTSRVASARASSIGTTAWP